MQGFSSLGTFRPAIADQRNELGIGVIGCRDQGSVIAGLAKSHGRLLAMADVDASVRDLSAIDPSVEKQTGLSPESIYDSVVRHKDYRRLLAAEGEICWAGMHSWKDMLDLLEEVGMPETLGFQADLAHTYLYLLGYNAPEHALLKDGYNNEEFYAAYEEMTDKLCPWTIDFHVAQNDGTVHGAGSHDKTGRN